MAAAGTVFVRGYTSDNASSQLQQMAAEFWFALQQTPSNELTSLVANLPLDFAKATARRGRNLGRLAKDIGVWSYEGILSAVQASQTGSLMRHLCNRANDVHSATAATYQQVDAVAKTLWENPKQHMPHLLVMVATALVVSGGPDGDGGVPDLDIPLLGIGAHRSPFTHSFLTGAALETIVLALLRAIAVVYQNLPSRRHPAWDKHAPHAVEFVNALGEGAAMGLAYHLLVDGLIQPAPYHGLPIEMPIEAHQAILASSGAAEAISAFSKSRWTK